MNIFAQYKQEAQLAEDEYKYTPKKSEIPAITRKKLDPKNWRLTADDLEKERLQNISHLQPQLAHPQSTQKIKEAVGQLQARVTPAGTSVTSTTGRIKATLDAGKTTIEPAEPKDPLKLKLDKKLSTVPAPASAPAPATYSEAASYAYYFEAALTRFGISSIRELDEEAISEFFRQIDEAFANGDTEYITQADK